MAGRAGGLWLVRRIIRGGVFVYFIELLILRSRAKISFSKLVLWFFSNTSKKEIAHGIEYAFKRKTD